MNIKTLLEEEKDRLENRINILKEKMANYPEGRLEIRKSHGSVQYFYEVCSSEQKRLLNNPEYEQKQRNSIKPGYLKKENIDLIKSLAQKSYELQILRIIERNRSILENLLEKYNGSDLNKVYSGMSRERQKLVIPIFLGDDEYAAQWQDSPYVKKGFKEGAPEIYTNKGERVRSKSEKIIADTLERNHVPYKYECQLQFPDGAVIHPDFTVLNKRNRKEYYFEHFGMMDDPEYALKAVKRIADYEAAGIMLGKQLVITMEAQKYPLNINALNRLINELFLTDVMI